MTRIPIAELLSLPHGPHDPVTGTPPRRPGSVRRTTSIDIRRGDPGRPVEVVARGRDLATLDDGTTDVRDEVEVRGTIDGAGIVTALEADPPVPAVARLVGAPVSRGFRLRVDEVLPDHRAAATVLHLLLDDLPMASMISGYGHSREVPDFKLPPTAAERMADVCAGWAGGATMLDVLERTGFFPIPIGPTAPDLLSAEDPLAWHELPRLEPRSIRRRRRLDVAGGDPLAVDVHFRDSHCDLDELEDVLHEYSLAATVDPATLTVLTSAAVARVLPWPECPEALASAGRIAGEPVAKLRWRVMADFKGTSTCTHLNDVLRSLGSVTALAGAVA